MQTFTLGKVTINNIAKKLKVSAGTVCRALNEPPGSSGATKQAVKKKAGQMDHRPSERNNLQ